MTSFHHIKPHIFIKSSLLENLNLVCVCVCVYVCVCVSILCQSQVLLNKHKIYVTLRDFSLGYKFKLNFKLVYVTK